MVFIDIKNDPCSRKDVKSSHYFKDLAKMSEKKFVLFFVERTWSSHYLYHIYLRKSPRHIRVDRFRPLDDTVPRYYSYHKTLYTLHHNHRHYIQTNNFRPRHYRVPRFYSYHKILYTLNHKHQHYIQTGIFRPRDDTVPRCYSYRTVLYTPYRTFYCRIL